MAKQSLSNSKHPPWHNALLIVDLCSSPRRREVLAADLVYPCQQTARWSNERRWESPEEKLQYMHTLTKESLRLCLDKETRSPWKQVHASVVQNNFSPSLRHQPSEMSHVSTPKHRPSFRQVNKLVWITVSVVCILPRVRTSMWRQSIIFLLADDSLCTQTHLSSSAHLSPFHTGCPLCRRRVNTASYGSTTPFLPHVTSHRTHVTHVPVS